jgi:hypothetical protein
MRRIARHIPLYVVFAGILAACEPGIPKEALELSPESLKDRQLQTRRFETRDEAKLLSASALLLQDLGFTLDESETRLGVIVGSKSRSAVNAGQVVFAIIIAGLGGGAMPIDKAQKMRASLVTRPIGDSGYSTAVRITFQRIVWNTNGQVTTAERMNDPKVYQEFFSKLSKSVFLEAHGI